MICFFIYGHVNNGHIVKKIVIFLFLIVFLCIKNVRPFNYMSNDSYNLHTLTFENLSTNNISLYFSNINIIKIYPYVNPIYSDKIGELFYEVRGYNLSDEINNFKEKYLNLIKKIVI